MAKSLKIMLIAGEASGDILGADLMKALASKYKPATFLGVGGEYMQKAGLESLFEMSELSVMGLVEVLPYLPRLKKRVDECVAFAAQEKPDVLVTIDSPDFTLRVAKKVKVQTGIPCVHMVSPSVWAWRRGRIKKMAGYLDHVLALFPFEPGLYAGSGLDCTFIGHPIYQRLEKYAPVRITPPKPETIALLPGSRQTEIDRLAPVCRQVLDLVRQERPNVKAIVPLADKKHQSLISPYFANADGVNYVAGDKKFDEMKAARLAIAASGTANLELAMLGLPMLVMYKTNPLTAFIARKIVHIPYISPVNWVLGHKTIPEFLQEEVEPTAMARHALSLFNNEEEWKKQAKALKEVRGKLGSDIHPAERAAEIVSTYL